MHVLGGVKIIVLLRTREGIHSIEYSGNIALGCDIRRYLMLNIGGISSQLGDLNHRSPKHRPDPPHVLRRILSHSGHLTPQLIEAFVHLAAQTVQFAFHLV